MTTTTTKKATIEIPSYPVIEDAGRLGQTNGEFTLPCILKDVVYYKNSDGNDRTSIVLVVKKAGSRDPLSQVQANFSYSWNDMTREQVAAWKDAAKIAEKNGGLDVNVTFEITGYLGGKPQIVCMAKR